MEKIALTCLGKMAEYLAAPVGRQFGYLFCFNANVETLKDEEKKLRDVKGGIQMRVDEVTRNVEDIFPNVQTWLKDVDTIGDDVQYIIQAKAEFPKGCFSRWCLKFKSRHALSRTAKKKTQIIVGLQKQGEAFQSVSCSAPPKSLIAPTSSTISLVGRIGGVRARRRAPRTEFVQHRKIKLNPGIAITVARPLYLRGSNPCNVRRVLTSCVG